MLIKHQSMKTYWGSLCTAPRTHLRSVETIRKWRSASGNSRFTSLRNPHPLPPTLAGAILSTSSCGTQADLGDRYHSLSYNIDWNICSTITVRL